VIKFESLFSNDHIERCVTFQKILTFLNLGTIDKSEIEKLTRKKSNQTEKRLIDNLELLAYADLGKYNALTYEMAKVFKYIN
jgi:hypothetical protein